MYDYRMFYSILSDLKTMQSLIILLAVFLGFAIGSLVQKLRNKVELKKQREDAVKKSRAVLGGQFGEQLAPFFPKFPCNPADVRFIGKPIDFIAFPGSAEGKPIKDVLFIEVKSGNSKLSAREKEIKNAIRTGKVHYVEYRLPEF